MLLFLHGDLFDGNAYAPINTVNTVGVVGKGIALKFKNEFPHNFNQYQTAFFKRELQIGKLSCVRDVGGNLGERLIINFPTKTYWRFPSEYSYVEQGLIAFKQYIDCEKIANVAVPALGCGSGGLDWQIVRVMICGYLEPSETVIEVYEPA
jgi:O-acetyl-ADP-ribose deacetylase (regulator of RNase III)